MKQKQMEEIIALCKQKDELAFQELYKEFYPVAYRLAFHISKSHADASDIAQETLIAVYDHIDNLRSPQFFPLWLKRIVVSKCNRVFRGNKHVTFVEDEVMIQQMLMDSKDINHPQRIIHFQNDQEVLHFFIKQLPEKQAEVLHHYYFDQWSIKEISEKLSLADGTVKSRMLLGKKQLKKLIKSYESKHDIELDFKSDAILSMAGLSVSFFSFHNLQQGLFSSLSSASSFVLVSTGLAIATCAVVGVQYIQSQQEDTNVIQPSIVQKNELPQKAFEPVEIAGKHVDTPRDAYFKILLWADQAEKLKIKDSQEVADFKILLNSLKDYGGPYYSAVLKLDWVKDFTNY